MKRRLFLLGGVATLAACARNEPQFVTGGTMGSTAPGTTNTTNTPGSSRYGDPNRFILDIPSVVGNAPLDTEGRRLGGPQAVAALRFGDLRSAGRREIVIFIWGAQGNLSASQMVNPSHQLGWARQVSLSITEISPRDAPRFDPVNQPPGTPRVFRIVLDGPMVSIALPRAAIGQDTHLLICGNGPTRYPDRVTRRTDGSVSQDGMWYIPAELGQLAHGVLNGRPITHQVVRPLVWQS